jgi:hypothetical protein
MSEEIIPPDQVVEALAGDTSTAREPARRLERIVDPLFKAAGLRV